MITKTESLINAIKRVITNYTEYELNKNNIEYKLYVDLNDRLDNSIIADFFKSDDPYVAFIDKLNDMQNCSFDKAVKEIIEEVKINWNSRKFPYYANKDYIEEWIEDNTVIVFSDLPYQKQMVCVNIIIDSGDAKYDFNLNNLQSACRTDLNAPIHNESSLLWLAKEQGYNKTQFKHSLKYPNATASKLLKSIREEILNTTTEMNAVVFLVKISLEDLFKLNQLNKNQWSKRKIRINKDTVCGLYDKWYGGGSLLGIQLEKDLEIPVRKIFSSVPDEAFEYSIANHYCVTSGLWDSVLTMDKTDKTICKFC